MPVGTYTPDSSNGNGVATVFPYSFKIFDQTTLVVTVDGVVKALGADYTVDGVGNSNGGNVTFLVAPANGTVVMRSRAVPYTRTEDYQSNGDFREETLDRDLDTREMQIQQLAAASARAFKAPTSVTADQALTEAQWAARASQFLGFDNAGVFGVFALLAPGALTVSAFWQTVIDDATAGAGVKTIVDALAEDTDPDEAADFLITLDASGATGKKVRAVYLAAAMMGAPAILNGRLDWSVAANVLTVAIKTDEGADPSAADPVWVLIRDVTAATPTLTAFKLTAATSCAVSNGSTLGVPANNTAFRVWAVGFNDAGTFRLGVINCLLTSTTNPSIFPLAAWSIAGSTAEGGAGAADSAHVFYTGAAVAAKPYGVIGYATWETGLAAAGAWAAGPTRAQMFGPGVSLPGQILQVAQTFDGASTTGTTVIPHDGTIPQNTEGDQYISQAITPSSAANLLDIEAKLSLSNSASGIAIAALFRDATANAIVASSESNRTATDPMTVSLRKTVLAAAAAATTFKVRAGLHAAGTTTFNGAYGGVQNSFLGATELMA